MIGSAMRFCGLARGHRAWLVLAAVACTVGVRVYLARRTCIGVDGVKYVASARAMHDGAFHRALAGVVPPGYPAAVAATYGLTGEWERAGITVSIVASAATVVPLAAVARLCGLAGPALAGTLFGFAVSPSPAFYGAQVRSEALYGLLLAIAVWAAAAALVRGRASLSVAGIASGVSYLVRTPGIGLGLALAGGIRWADRTRISVGQAALVALITVAAAAPYVLYLHADTGRWMLSRQDAKVLADGISVANGEAANSALTPSVLGVIAARSGAFKRKLLVDSWRTFYVYAKCLYYLFVPFLVIGFVAARTHYPAVHRLLLVLHVVQLAACALVFVGRRYYAPIVPLSMVWCGTGFGIVWDRLERHGVWVARATAAGLAAFVLVGPHGTLLLHGDAECGYVRSFGEAIAYADHATPVIAARDIRVPFYAGGRRAAVEFPLDVQAVDHLLDGGAGWLVVQDGDLAADAPARVSAAGERLTLVREARAGQRRRVRLYRIDVGR